MNKISMFVTFAALLLRVCPATAQIEVKATPSETVELMYVMMSLTDVPSFSPPSVWPEYKTFVNSWFAKYKNHSAIKFIVNKIMTENIDMVISASIGVSSDIVDGKFFYPGNNYGWRDKTKERFVEEVNKFYRDTNFRTFWEHVQDNFYPQVINAFNDTIIPKLNLGWLNHFVPVEGNRNYGLTISLLSGDYNFGVSKGGVPNPVLGVWDINMILNPTPKTLERYLPVTIHEYLHPFCNPLIDKYYSELRRAGEVIFPKISERVTKRHYGEWRTVLYESLVRASVIAFMHSDDFFSQSLNAHIEREKEIGFYYIEELSELLLEYEADRDTYPTLDSFMPQIVDFYKKLASKSES